MFNPLYYDSCIDFIRSRSFSSKCEERELRYSFKHEERERQRVIGIFMYSIFQTKRNFMS